MRKAYVTYLRSATTATILAVSVLVTAQNYVLWMPNLYR